MKSVPRGKVGHPPNLRELDSELDAKLKVVQQSQASGEIQQEQAFKDMMAARQEISQNFDKSLASDADNVQNELRGRLSPEVLNHIVRVPAFVEIPGGSRLTLSEMMRGSGFDTPYIHGLANEIEEMAKMLPSDHTKHWW
jgi:hypothetical protein